MTVSRNMSRLIDYARHNLDNVSVGVTAGLKAPKQGIGIEFTVQKKEQRWGFRFRQESAKDRKLFHVTEQRSGLFHYGLRGNYGMHGGAETTIHPHPLKLSEIVERWPPGFWPEGLAILKLLANVSTK